MRTVKQDGLTQGQPRPLCQDVGRGQHHGASPLMATRLQGPGGTKVLNSYFHPKGIHSHGLPQSP